MERYIIDDFVDLLDISSDAEIKLYDSTGNNKSNAFSDMGAWHGYYNLNVDRTELYGGFAGPLIIAEEYGANLSDCISKIIIKNSDTGEIYDLSSCSDKSFKYYPGRVYQKYNMNDITLVLELIFVNKRTALIKTTIKNTSERKIMLKVMWSGRIYNEDSKGNNLKQRFESNDLGVKIIFSNIRNNSTFLSSGDASFFINYPSNVTTKIYNNEYESKLINPITIEKEEEHILFSTQSYVFTKDEYDYENKESLKIIHDGDKYFKKNLDIWQGYIDKTFLSDKSHLPFSYKKAIVKGVITLITNWRSDAGAIKYGGVTPSISYKGFNGLWPWDSFKQAVALAYFNEELAKDNIRAIFHYQIKSGDVVRPNDEGSLIDTVFYNKDKYRGEQGENWNERNSKPPLGTWAVWKLYEVTHDKKFLVEIYDNLIGYHNWWYKNRDFNKNGICEYGAMVHDDHQRVNEKGNIKLIEKNIIEAAAWESGMDNAPRFDVEGYKENDGVKILLNKNDDGDTISYSINQESVDLNSYLYYEKILLAKIAEIIDKKEDNIRFTKEANKISKYIQENMYDNNSGYFYDIKVKESIDETIIDKNTLLVDNENDDIIKSSYDYGEILTCRGKGCEGFIPLWAEVASKDQGREVIENILNKDMFNTYFPLPTVSRDNTKYAPTKYWRGPVWLDQAYFVIDGLSKYGYKKESIMLAKKLFDNGEGVLGDLPIRENYNPENGEGLHCKNFSWSAAMLYILYQEIL
ncbi:MAG: trehalase family glycosidase [Clostridium sp.]|uniref:MGH1-like glycoside hydrolase domain-containing protein n=1 Tax=Clostridium sp. TaxID=1506 RepID=UPI0030613961